MLQRPNAGCVHMFCGQLIGGGGGNSLRPYSQQRPMRTNLSSCLSLIHHGQNHSTNRLLTLVPHEGTHGTMCLTKQLRMFRPKITKMRAIKEACRSSLTAHVVQKVHAQSSGSTVATVICNVATVAPCFCHTVYMCIAPRPLLRCAIPQAR